MKILLSFMFLIISVTLHAQTGNYFLSHYSPTKEHFDNICFDMAQDERGVMYFASKAGITLFDGRNWDMLRGQSAIYSIQIDNADNIYWSGVKGFGTVSLNRDGFQELKLLSDSTVADVFQTLVVKDQVYFLSDRFIYDYNTNDKSVSKIATENPQGSFNRLFELYGAVYVNTTDDGVYKIDQKKITRSKLGISGDVIFYSRIDNTYVLGTTDNKIYACDESLILKPISLQDQQYADASVIVSGTWIHRQLLALGTLRGGVIFLNPITGRTEEIINYNTGLPDNEVFSLKQDRNLNVWVAHEYGFTRISPHTPFKSFSHYDGLHGNLLCANSFNGSVYVGTSLGLFKLSKEDVYEELVYYVNVDISQPKKTGDTSSKKNESTAVQTEPRTETVAESQQSTESKKKGLFNFLKRNKNKDSGSKAKEEVASKEVPTKTKEQAEVVADQKSDTEEPKYKRVKKVDRILRASQFVFKKVEGIDAKVTHLLDVKGKLVASGLAGVYEIDGLKSKSVLQEPVRYLYAMRESSTLFASTYEDEIKKLTYQPKGWSIETLPLNPDDQIDYIFEGKDLELMFCGLNKVYRYNVSETPNEVKPIDLYNPDMVSTIGARMENNRLIFANQEGFYTLDVNDSQLQRIDSLPKPSQYFPYNGSILYRDRHGWHVAGKSNTESNLQLLNLFQNLRFITADQQKGNLWMISGSNELYKFYGDKIGSDENAFPLLLRTITNADLRTASKSKIHISEDKSAVTFEIVQPDYVSPEAIEFRYQLRGMKDEWSEWASNNNKIDFPYLPPGEYTLEVESRNVFGVVTQLDPVKFEVLPPYWKRSWFYAMEFALLASLVLLSFRLNSRYRIVSRILSLLTIILLIEFIQTVINANLTFNEESPVIDFIIQVFVALLVLPVEGYLRNLMFRSLDSSSKFYQFIMPKTAAVSDKGKLEAFEIEEDDEPDAYR